jgi:hypothetical protein
MEPEELGTGYRLEDRRFDSRQKQNIFLYSTAPTAVPGLTQPPIQWVSGIIFLQVKRLGREADHSPPTSAEVKKMWIYTPIPTYAFMA